MSNRISQQHFGQSITKSKKTTLTIQEHDTTGIVILAPQGIKIQGKQCRICLESGKLIRACKCTGTAAYVHFKCLQYWIMKKSEDKNGVVRHLHDVKCQMCRYRYNYHSKTIINFTCEELNCNRYFRTDIIIQLFFSLVFLIGAVVCGILYFSFLANKPLTGDQTSIVAICLVVSFPICMVIGSYLLYTFTKNYLMHKSKIIVEIQEYVPFQHEKGQNKPPKSAREVQVSINMQ